MAVAGIDLFSSDFQEDPYPSYAQLRKEAPVYREPRYGVYVLTRYADVDATLRDHETFRSGAGKRLCDAFNYYVGSSDNRFYRTR